MARKRYPVIQEGLAIVRVLSVCARRELAAYLGYLPRGYHRISDNREWREVPISKVQNAFKIYGVMPSFWFNDLELCTDWDDSEPIERIKNASESETGIDSHGQTQTDGCERTFIALDQRAGEGEESQALWLQEALDG